MANIMAFIPARGGSKGVPHKNVRILGDKPLVAHAIDISTKSKYINKVVVSTDDATIGDVAKSYGADVVERPKELATDTSVVSDAIRFTVQALRNKEGYEVDIIVLLECTSPIKSIDDIDRGIEQVLSGYADSCASFRETSPSPHRLWKIDDQTVKPFIDGANPFLSRQLQPVGYELTGQFYVVSNQAMQENPDSISILLGKVVPIISTTKYVVDIDDEIDFIIAEEYLKKLK
jgi:CMP-N,N'-diacetyllegionaminic acid synthase